ncbi:probable prolyl 4-hydroxylase 9 isoform X2 [Vicia villosa]|uniref:probable prolyl 4-hydroxylase 9 isoform X2 n=1 Tax=Vicia villosa TaxID=3911 RepID=UPI00273BF04B|nr:probable prolyl 4-hydroxylase 9 isoform X2 [Vicia villosa]
MKGKVKISKLKLSIPILCLCLFFFFLGLFMSPIVFQNWVDEGSHLRIHQDFVKKEYDPIQHGKSGESFVESIPFQILSLNPRAVYFPNFTSVETCEQIIEMAKPTVEPSKLALRKGEDAESTKGTRTSSGVFIGASEDKSGILDMIERKIAKVTMIPKTYGEDFNILRYEVGQKYDSHYDAFDPAEYGHVDSQRVASFLLYLSNVEMGGETMFPYEVKPRQGDGLLFYSVFPNGKIDKNSLHGSCPVIKGEKWVATKWINDKQQQRHY